MCVVFLQLTGGGGVGKGEGEGDLTWPTAICSLKAVAVSPGLQVLDHVAVSCPLKTASRGKALQQQLDGLSILEMDWVEHLGRVFGDMNT